MDTKFTTQVPFNEGDAALLLEVLLVEILQLSAHPFRDFLGEERYLNHDQAPFQRCSHLLMIHMEV